MSEQDRFRVDTSTDGLDISTELYRTYTFPGGEEIVVQEPSMLWVKLSSSPGMAGKHSHRIALMNGNGVYIPAGWLKIEWRNREGALPVAW